MRIKTEKYGIIHYLAQCKDCNWDCGIVSEGAEYPQDVRNKVYSHIRKTKHRVVIEGGTATDYYVE